MSKRNVVSSSKKLTKPSSLRDSLRRGSIKVSGIEIFDGEDISKLVMYRNGFKITIEDTGDDDRDESSSTSSSSFT